MSHAPNSLSCQRRIARGQRENKRKFEVGWKSNLSTGAEIILQQVLGGPDEVVVRPANRTYFPVPPATMLRIVC